MLVPVLAVSILDSFSALAYTFLWHLFVSYYEEIHLLRLTYAVADIIALSVTMVGVL